MTSTKIKGFAGFLALLIGMFGYAVIEKDELAELQNDANLASSYSQEVNSIQSNYNNLFNEYSLLDQQHNDLSLKYNQLINSTPDDVPVIISEFKNLDLEYSPAFESLLTNGYVCTHKIFGENNTLIDVYDILNIESISTYASSPVYGSFNINFKIKVSAGDSFVGSLPEQYKDCFIFDSGIESNHLIVKFTDKASSVYWTEIYMPSTGNSEKTEYISRSLTSLQRSLWLTGGEPPSFYVDCYTE